MYLLNIMLINNIMHKYIIIFAIILILAVYLKRNININITIFIYLVLLRGLICQNKFWWDVSDMLGINKSGIKLFNMIEDRTKNNFILYRLQTKMSI